MDMEWTLALLSQICQQLHWMPTRHHQASHNTFKKQPLLAQAPVCSSAQEVCLLFPVRWLKGVAIPALRRPHVDANAIPSLPYLC